MTFQQRFYLIILLRDMRMLDLLFASFIFLTSIFHHGLAEVEKDCAPANAGVYVSVSAEAEHINGTGYLRWLEVTWFGITDLQPGDSVGLWGEDPSLSLDSVIEQQEVVDVEGILRLQEQWDGSLMPSTVVDVEDSCFPYWAGFIRNGEVLYSSCLMLRPKWMAGMKAELSTRRISEIALPGTHDAGATGHFENIIGSLVGRWTFAQDENFFQQLVLGVRYLDLRISYYNNTEEKLFVNHGEVRVAPLQLYIDDVVVFMSQTEEIVIFDIHSLSYFNVHPERHDELIAVLEQNFGEWMVPNSMSPNPTLAELWDSGKRLIVTYPSSEGSTSPYLWSNVYHLWGDVNELADLENFMDTEIPQQVGRGSLWSAMAEFTPTPLDVTLNRWGGLRGAATITNTPVTKWFRERWWSMVNIVAMDFFFSSDVVSVAVEANKNRFRCPSLGVDPNNTGYESSSDSAVMDPTLKAVNTSEAQIWVWVSALASISTDGQRTQRQLEINWDIDTFQEGDWVGLYDHDPRFSWSDPVEETASVAGVTHYLTSYSMPYLALNSSLEENTCLGWWAAYIRNDTPIAINCIKAHPRWISAMQDLLQNVPIGQIVIPQVHDAGTYTEFSEYAENALAKYAITQDESIYNTLVFGYRYIDLRAGYFEADTEEPYWVVHGITVWRPFRVVLQEIKRFIDETDEPTIIQIGGFTFFSTSEHHAGCVALVLEELGSVMAPNTTAWDTLVGDLLNSTSNLIVLYDHSEAVAGNELFWPNIAGFWANAQSLEQLEAYMINVIEGEGGPPSRPWSISGQLTPLASDVVLDTMGGLRPMADAVNRNVTRWFRDRWWDKISIISCDFVLSSGYIDLAIDINIKRFG